MHTATAAIDTEELAYRGAYVAQQLALEHVRDHETEDEQRIFRHAVDEFLMFTSMVTDLDVRPDLDIMRLEIVEQLCAYRIDGEAVGLNMTGLNTPIR